MPLQIGKIDNIDDATLDRVSKSIEENGYTIVSVVADAYDKLPYTYTVGLSLSYDLPELWISGEDSQDTISFIRKVAGALIQLNVDAPGKDRILKTSMDMIPVSLRDELYRRSEQRFKLMHMVYARRNKPVPDIMQISRPHEDSRTSLPIQENAQYLH